MLLKAMYGLVDGPLLWQMALIHFLTKELFFQPSLHDSSFLYRCDNYQLVAILVVHVDDILLVMSDEFFKWLVAKIEKKFGKVKQGGLPFTCLGVEHQLLRPGHVLLHQGKYCDGLKEIKINKDRLRDPTSGLERQEHFEFRSLLCSVLWLCLTRDLQHETVSLQGEMVTPQIVHVVRLNTLVRRAKKHAPRMDCTFANFRLL